MYGRAVAFAVALVAAVGCSSADPAPTSVPAPDPTPTPIVSAEVSIAKRVFAPQAIIVSRGGTVTFTNEEETEHTVTFSSSAVESVERFSNGSRDVAMPDAPGTYEYHCAIHPSERGSIQVE